CMAGQPPQPADQRELEDKLPATIEAMDGVYSRALLDLVGWCLKLNALERPQSVFALQRALRGIEAPEEALRRPSTVGRWLDTLTNRVSPRRRDGEGLTLPS
ncbi:MAG: serine/threonine protein kinase, partial [Burkholderiaceae bacterium]